MRFLAAAVQLTTTSDPRASLDAAEAGVAEAARLGARFVALPENVSFMGSEEEKLRLAESLDGPSFQRLAGWARRHSIWLLGGTLPEKSLDTPRAFNTSTLFSPEGRLVAAYRKIHLFDVELGEGATHRESSSVEPGRHPVLAETPLGKIGLSVCYDLRFATLYRALVRRGAEILTVPAAFTVPTGRDHWEVLLRARAIENLAYVIAPGQFGANTDTRRTFGRSMIIDPWGTVLAVVPDRTGVALAEIDLGRVAELRKNLPCLAHERPQADAAVELKS
ncbi:MAG: carbon-nitrogen hydrolase family protein [Deltaproteobacteria bacterium]|nr:carbon-nitrogen hydrolase family protein [Deltaproteobacteria bacterium]